MKGIDKLINGLASYGCPIDSDLKNVNEVPTFEGCMYGDGGSPIACQDCWRKSLDMEYEE